ncbi:6452_t:CDS:2 [Paraglomus occultum]|uniref:6452_t:CDS:1 n=1 Tax=Paraglomus occultum TaxID=144539 RepID=A0A9N9B3C2_9GLOM|nr:6452_t:CDS:2 [Paraglomus occultum]
MKFTHTIIFSLLLLAVCTAAKPRAKIVDYIPATEILPLPVSVETVDDKPNEYIVKTSLYANGYDHYGGVETKLLCESGVKVKHVIPKFKLNEIDAFRTDFKLSVPEDKKIVTCVRQVINEEGARNISFTFNPVH